MVKAAAIASIFTMKTTLYLYHRQLYRTFLRFCMHEDCNRHGMKEENEENVEITIMK